MMQDDKMNRRNFLTGLLSTVAATAITHCPSASEYVNVLDYGAIPDGITDCAFAFNQAFSAVGDGGIVFVPPGHYILGGPFVLPNRTIKGAGATISCLTILDHS